MDAAPRVRAADLVAVDTADAQRLQQLGYEQQLRRRIGIAGNVAIGFATISPVVALYGVVLVGMLAAGPSWVWALPICLAGQCLLITVYSELAAEFPIAGGAYQWTRRLLGPSYAWLTGWIALCAYLVANTTIAYLAAPWLYALLGVAPSANGLVLVAAAFIVACALASAFGIDVLRTLVNVGIAAEVIATVTVALALLLVFRSQPLSVLVTTLGAEAGSGGSHVSAFLAAVAVGGWAFLGFDACVATAEETHDAARHVPRALWWALLSVGTLVIVNAFAITLAHPDPASVVAGRDLDPVTTAIVSSFGSWSAKPFTAAVVVAFVACGMAAQGATARGIYSVARDDVVPGSRFLKAVAGRQVPLGATITVAVVGCAGLLLALNDAAIGSLITFGTAGIYLVFLLIALAALVARLSGAWTPGGHIRLGRLGTAINALAVLWLAFEFVNVAWPRPLLAPPGAPWYQLWAAPLVITFVAVTGALYLVVARPQQKVARSAAFGSRS